MRRAAASGLVTLLLVFASARAEGACNKPDLEDAVPPDGAVDVPPNARLTARYAPNAEYLNEDIVIEHVGVGEETLPGDWNSAETLLSVTPTLLPGERYVIHWPRLRGLNSANLGRGAEIAFTVGTVSDEQPPTFAGLESVQWDVDRARDDCTDNLEERYLFDFGFGAASDDGGRDSLMLVVFQTKGPHVDAKSPVPVLVRRLPPAGETVRLSTTIREGLGDVCFAAVVRDLTGKPSASGSREVCVETVEPPFFAGCSTRRGPRDAPWPGIGLALAALLTRRIARGARIRAGAPRRGRG